MSTILKPYEFNGQIIEVPFTDAAFFNATVAAKPFGKLPKDWLKTEEAQTYIEAVRRKILTEQNQLVKVVQGGNPNQQGTWLHPKLGVAFARWLNVDFALWCDDQIESILHSSFTLTTPQPAFREKTRKALPGGLTIEQQDAIKELIKSRVEALPHDQQAHAAQTCWAAIKSKFEVEHYKAVPASEYAAVLSLIARLSLGEPSVPKFAARNEGLAEEIIRPAQQAEIRHKAHRIGCCFIVRKGGAQAAFALIRESFGVASAYQLPTRYFDEAMNLLDAANRQADQYLLRKAKLDQFFLRKRFRVSVPEVDQSIADLERWIAQTALSATAPSALTLFC